MQETTNLTARKYTQKIAKMQIKTETDKFSHTGTNRMYSYYLVLTYYTEATNFISYIFIQIQKFVYY
jgi:hypothetical protein